MVTTTFPVETSVEYFESIYSSAAGEAARIPWCDDQPHPALITWLNAVAPSLVRCGSRVCVVGCGLGEDARELMRRGYEVTAFDCSPTAVAWAKRIDAINSHCYVQADLFNPPLRWRHRFDLVVEVNTIQSLTPDMHGRALSAISGTLSPRGHLLVICRAADDSPQLDDGPPWALTESEIVSLAEEAGLVPAGPISIFTDDEDPPVQRMRAVFKRR